MCVQDGQLAAALQHSSSASLCSSWVQFDTLQVPSWAGRASLQLVW